MFLDDRFVESCGFLVLGLLHEEHVGNIQLPHVLVVAELDRLAKDLLYLDKIITVPINLCLLHQNRQIPDSNTISTDVLMIQKLSTKLPRECTHTCNIKHRLLIGSTCHLYQSLQLQKQTVAIIHFYTMLLIITNNRIFSHVCVLSVLSGFYVTSLNVFHISSDNL